MKNICSCFIRDEQIQNIITLTLNTFIEKIYINIDIIYLNDYMYLYNIITKKLIEIYGQFIDNDKIMITIFYLNNDKKIYIYMSMINYKLTLDLEDINNDFFLEKSILSHNEINIISINNSYMEKYNNYNIFKLYSIIRKYLNTNNIKIFNINLMILLNTSYNIELQYANYKLLNNKTFLIPLMEIHDNWKLVCNPHFYNLQHVLLNYIKNDEDIIIAALKSPNIDKFSFIDFSDKLRHNKNIVLAALENGQKLVLKYTSNKIKNDILL